MNDIPRFPALFWRLLLAAALVAVFLMTDTRASDCDCVASAQVSSSPEQVESWIFAQGRYTHDPDSGGRVAQYAMKPPVEPLPDPRAVTSGYTRSRTVLRGADGSVGTSYRVQSYGNGRGGLDAEWERFHDAWRGSTSAGGNFFASPGIGFGGGFGGGFPGYGYGGYGNGGYGNAGPGGGFPPNVGQPGYRYDPSQRFDPRQRYGPRERFGPGFGRPDAGRLDPDGANGYPDGRTRTPDGRFFDQAVPTPAQLYPKPHPKPHPKP